MELIWLCHSNTHHQQLCRTDFKLRFLKLHVLKVCTQKNTHTIHSYTPIMSEALLYTYMCIIPILDFLFPSFCCVVIASVFLFPPFAVRTCVAVLVVIFYFCFSSFSYELKKKKKCRHLQQTQAARMKEQTTAMKKQIHVDKEKQNKKPYL